MPGGSGDNIIAVKKQAEEMGYAMMKKDYKTYIKFMHPKVIAHMGGEQGVLDTMKSVEAHMAKYGMKLAYINLDEPTPIIDTAGELQCTISSNADITVKGGVIHANSVFICISKDKGLHWVYIDISSDYEWVRNEMKTLSSKLVIPVPQKPSFEDVEAK